MPDQPNILFILADQQRFDTLACYGNSLIQTPNLNALAERSFVFENAYVASPICAPARSTLLTGLWPHTSGVKVNNIPLPPGVKTGRHGSRQLLRTDGSDIRAGCVGYRKTCIAKLHFPYHHFLVDRVPEVYDRLGVYSDEEFKIRPAEGKGMDTFSLRFVSKLPEEFTKASFLGMRRNSKTTRGHSSSP